MSPEVSSKTLEEIDEAKEGEDLRTLEAVLFISGRYLSAQEIISFTDLSPIILGELIDKLKDKYSKKESAIEIVEKAGSWKMDVRQEFSHIINKFATGSAEFTKAEQETLAIIAYKQPIKQSVIIKIRGNKAYDHIKRFVELNLIKRKKEGHTHVLGLSDDFYDYFTVADTDNPLRISDEEFEEAEKEVEAEEGNRGSGKEESDEIEKDVEVAVAINEFRDNGEEDSFVGEDEDEDEDMDEDGFVQHEVLYSPEELEKKSDSGEN